MRAQRWIGLLGMLAALAGMSGCMWHGAQRVTPAEERTPRKEASREQLIAMLEQEMSRLATLSAKASVTAVKQDVLVPASVPDDMRRMRGKPFQRKFAEAQLNGILLFSRAPDGSRKIRFSGEVIGPQVSFMLLGKNNDFWVVMPNANRNEDDKKASRGTVYTGTMSRESVRPKGAFSLRPQDVIDLLLYDEIYDVLNEGTICYMETWPDFYVLTFLRPDWPEHLYSRIWIERENLTMQIHQLFDGAGAIVAEGRFGEYKPFSAKGSNLVTQLPTHFEFLWPRDQLVMQVELSNIKVNTELNSTYFEPKFPKDYKEERLQNLLIQPSKTP